jgi:hypothetical protein
MKICKLLEVRSTCSKKLGASTSGLDDSQRLRNPSKSGKNETRTADLHENNGSHDIFTENKSGFSSENSGVDENGTGFMSENARTTLELNRKFTLVAPISVLWVSRQCPSMAKTCPDAFDRDGRGTFRWHFQMTPLLSTGWLVIVCGILMEAQHHAENPSGEIEIRKKRRRG